MEKNHKGGDRRGGSEGSGKYRGREGGNAGVREKSEGQEGLSEGRVAAGER